MTNETSDGWHAVREWPNDRIIEGYMTTQALDKQGDVVPTDIVEKHMDYISTYAPIIIKHGKTPVVLGGGNIIAWKRDEKGIAIRVGFPGPGSDIMDKVWAMVKAAGVRGGFSIGGSISRKCDGVKCIAEKVDIVEVSWVDNPANPEAKVTSVSMAKDETAKRHFEPPESGDLPEGKKRLLARVYSECRQRWVDEHPGDAENAGNKESCARQAWSVVNKEEAVTKPFGGYSDFADCVAHNKYKDDPQAYCAAIMQQVEGKDADFLRRVVKSMWGIITKAGLHKSLVCADCKPEATEKAREASAETQCMDRYKNEDGTFTNGFDGCVEAMQNCRGLGEERAKAICAAIGRRAGRIKTADLNEALDVMREAGLLGKCACSETLKDVPAVTNARDALAQEVLVAMTKADESKPNAAAPLTSAAAPEKKQEPPSTQADDKDARIARLEAQVQELLSTLAKKPTALAEAPKPEPPKPEPPKEEKPKAEASAPYEARIKALEQALVGKQGAPPPRGHHPEGGAASPVPLVKSASDPRNHRRIGMALLTGTKG